MALTSSFTSPPCLMVFVIIIIMITIFIPLYSVVCIFSILFRTISFFLDVVEIYVLARSLYSLFWLAVVKTYSFFHKPKWSTVIDSMEFLLRFENLIFKNLWEVKFRNGCMFWWLPSHVPRYCVGIGRMISSQ